MLNVPKIAVNEWFSAKTFKKDTTKTKILLIFLIFGYLEYWPFRKSIETVCFLYARMFYFHSSKSVVKEARLYFENILEKELSLYNSH